MWHRQVAALAAAADRVGVAATELPEVRARLLAQRSSFAEAAAAAGGPLPNLVPSPTEVAAAMPALGDLSAGAVRAAIQTISSTLDATDAALAAHRTPPPRAMALAAGHQVTPRATGLAAWPAEGRNALVYGGYALTVLIVQLVLLAVLDEQRALPLLSPVCLVILPAFAWAAGWFTIGVAFRPPPGGPPLKRTPRLGALVCLAPNLLLCAGVGALFLAR